MKTALHLREYEDILDPADIYSLLGTLVTYWLNLIENGNYICDSETEGVAIGCHS